MQIRVTKPLSTPSRSASRRWRRSWPSRARSGVSSRRPRIPSSFRRTPTIPPTKAPSPTIPMRGSSNSPRPFRPSPETLVTIPFQPKAIQDEMGEAFDTEYGRMSGFLGVQLPAQAGQQAFTLYPLPLLPSRSSRIPSTPLSPVRRGRHPDLEDHPQRRGHAHDPLPPDERPAPEPGRLGQRRQRSRRQRARLEGNRPGQSARGYDRGPETVCPDFALRRAQQLRPIDVTKPIGATLMGGPGGFKDPLGIPVTVVNHLVNCGWEYVLHCHLLGHEEMDMMHAWPSPSCPRAFRADGHTEPRRDERRSDLGGQLRQRNGLHCPAGVGCGFHRILMTRSLSALTSRISSITGLDPTSTYFLEGHRQ